MVDIEELVRAAKEAAWAEGYDAGYEDGYEDDPQPNNPYAKVSN